jgi:hypothetical protein
MLSHLCDQMRMPYADPPCPLIPGVYHYPVIRELVLYLLPWPKQVQGPLEAFRTSPAVWAEDVATLKKLVDQFIAASEDLPCAGHPILGALNHRAWGYFSYRHLDHHLRQFGA